MREQSPNALGLQFVTMLEFIKSHLILVLCLRAWLPCAIVDWLLGNCVDVYPKGLETC